MSQSAEQQAIQLFLNSSAGLNFDESYYHTVRYTLPRPLLLPDGYQWHVALRGLSCVNSQLVVNGYCNSVWITFAGMGTSQYTLAEGNYDALSLCAGLNALTAAANGVIWIYDSVTLKVTARCNTSFTIGGTLPSELLDIPEGTTGTEMSSVRTVALTGVQSIIVDVDLAGNNITLGPLGNSTTTLARVQNDTAPLSVLHYSSTVGGNLVHDEVISAFTVSLYDQIGRPLLCTLPYDMTLEFKPVYTGRMQMRSERPNALNIPY
jgi:hypothetical protein